MGSSPSALVQTGTDIVVVLCTVPAAAATALADELLEARLVACANLIGPLQSRYRWQGQIETADEILLVLKTTRESVSGLAAKIVELHSYAVPEVLVLPVEAGLKSYLAWVAGEC